MDLNFSMDALFNDLFAFEKSFDLAIETIKDCRAYFEDFKDTKKVGYFSCEQYDRWLNAVEIIVGNVNRYLPVPLDDTYDAYNGFDKYRLRDLFIVFLDIELSDYNPEYSIIMIDGMDNEDIVKEYVNEHPDVCRFLDVYYPKKFIPLTTKSMEAYMKDPNYVNYKSDDIYKMLYWGIQSHFSEYYIRINYKFIVGDKTLTFRCRIPRYFKNGNKVGWWNKTKSYQKSFIDDSFQKQQMQEYFECYPEKKEEYLKKTASYEKAIRKKEELETTLSSHQYDKKKYINQLSENENRIDTLSKKIFFKSKAKEEIASLINNNDTIRRKLDILTSEMTKIENDIKKIPQEEQFYKQLLKDMDYFIIWHWSE